MTEIMTFAGLRRIPVIIDVTHIRVCCAIIPDHGASSE